MDHSDSAQVQAEQKKLSATVLWLNEKYRDISLSGGTREHIAYACLDTALEHQMAIELLGRASLYGSMHALLRSLFEAFIRGSWFARCATDDEIEYFRRKDDIKKGFGTLVKEVETALGHQEAVLTNIKLKSWDAMNSFTHTGVAQLSRRSGANALELAFPERDIISVLRAAGSMGLLAAMEMATIAGLEDLARETLTQAKS